jgi:hypothetical protein
MVSVQQVGEWLGNAVIVVDDSTQHFVLPDLSGVGVSEDGEWMIVVHWETAEDNAASIAKFGEAPGVETFMSFLDAESMAITVYDIQQ